MPPHRILNLSEFCTHRPFAQRFAAAVGFWCQRCAQSLVAVPGILSEARALKKDEPELTNRSAMND